MDVLNSLGGDIPPDPGGGAWKATGYITNRISSPYISKKRDFIFSTAREIPGNNMEERREWVYLFLKKHGCFDDYDEVSDVIKRMRISSNTRKEQVIIECVSEKQPEKLAAALRDIPAPFHMFCPAMMPTEVPVYISWVRSTTDIQKHLIDNFLSKYGEVRSHRAITDKRGVETFEHVFYMREEDLRSNPPPNFVWMGKTKLRVKYRGQVTTCFICDSPDHLVGECPKKLNRINKPEIFIPPRYDRHFPALIPTPKSDNLNPGVTLAGNNESNSTAPLNGQNSQTSSKNNNNSVPSQVSQSVPFSSDAVLSGGTLENGKRKSDELSLSSSDEEFKKTKTENTTIGKVFVDGVPNNVVADDQEKMLVNDLLDTSSQNHEDPPPPAAPPEQANSN